MTVLMARYCTDIGMTNATGIGITTDYGVGMSSRAMPALWESVCRAAGLPPDASIDRVLDAYQHSVGRGTLQRIRDGDSPRMASLEKLADAIGLSAVSGLLPPPLGGVGAAGSLSEPAMHEHPPLITWGDIVNSREPLPHRFRCEVPDDALWSSTEGGTPRGTPVVFVATSQPPTPGTGVIVEDRTGARYLRVYRLGLGERWLAAVRNPNYPALDSERDGLRIVAVAEHRMLDGQL